MSTTNGFGTTRYDWYGRPDGTAEATVWFVIFFLPIIPLRREHVIVHCSGIKPSGFWDAVYAFFGAGSGFESTIEVLGIVPWTLFSILKTYFMGLIVVPFVTVVAPFAFLLVGFKLTEQFGMDLKAHAKVVIPIFTIGVVLWVASVIAWILDRSAGRQHVYSPSNHRE